MEIESSSKNEFDKLNDNLNRLELIYDDSFKGVFTVKDSFIWFTLFDRFTALNLPDTRFSGFIKEFNNVLSKKEIDGKAFFEIDRKRSTKDKTVIVEKLKILEALMHEYLRNHSLSLETEAFIADVLDIDIEKVKEEMEVYNETLDDLADKTIKDGSKLLDGENRMSLLAMVAYSYEKDVDLDEWLTEYAEKNNRYFPDQRKNFLYMRSELEKSNKKAGIFRSLINETYRISCRSCGGGIPKQNSMAILNNGENM